ncbi:MULTISPECIES: helix-turn-helix domain-containing protein [unclassified Chryseobacterium]|uniref:helix-turn-helix domain-containing protein n=1 Tax=unclassified Chryseobacterium TaxID=2593645 RepID=UPI0021E546CD|nr:MULTISPECIES: helix-turn-helix domain-containing protein [unclassified Chryseobacterium]MEA1851052.1 helix-turn-helix domain-containing protein [Chryseobacterium sp. MHB01]
MIKKLLLLFCTICFHFFLSQESETVYDELRKKYENFEENDFRAFQYIRPYIAKSKKEKNYSKLVQGYKDAVLFASLDEEKLKYSDSLVRAANLSGDKDLMIVAHIDKGVIYYYNYKKYQLALNEYLEAYQYSKNTKNEYLKHQNLYHIGVVKSYLGYYDEAADLFSKCLLYYREKSKADIHPNLIYNNKKGYLNSLHQLIICYRHLGRYKDMDVAIKKGLSEAGNNRDYAQEKGYFLLSKGISEYREKQYETALTDLNLSLPSIRHSRDFARLSVNYFFIGKSYLGMNDTQKSVFYFRKIDSIFNKHQFILPELRENYEILINYSKKNKDQAQQLYYTGQLLKADSIMSRDFSYLSPKIHKDYDTKTLLEEKNKLQKMNYLVTVIVILLIIWAIGLIMLFTKRQKKAKEIKQKYILLEEKFVKDQAIGEISSTVLEEKKIHLHESKVEELLHKLKKFENKKGFTQKGLTLNRLAQQLGTNSSYLSQVINEYKGGNFNKYLSQLRINYITNLLFEDKKYLKYNIETLARECGIASRQNFSDLFYEINGIRPTDFIKKRMQEMDNGGN